MSATTSPPSTNLASSPFPAPVSHGRLRICVVGSGTHFLSGITYYTHRLAMALAERHQVTAILMRRLLPARLYPGRARVGAKLTEMQYSEDVEVFDGVDWHWLPSILKAAAFLRRSRPQVIVLQWWTGTVLHSYLALTLLARVLLRARVVIEFHESLDTGELAIPLARIYVRTLAPLLMRMADGVVVHSEHDRESVTERYGLAGRPVATIPHGPYDQYMRGDAVTKGGEAGARVVVNRTGSTTPLPGDPDICRLLFFGVIRPFKGLEDLITGFNSLAPEEARRFHLTVVGETWEGWTLPAELMERSPRRNRIEFINRYVSDEEVHRYFSSADAVVLPYHRSSASGPLHVAMSYGLPVIVTAVGGLTEASEGYQGAIRIPPRDPSAIRNALKRVYPLRNERFADIHSWERTLSEYDRLLSTVAPTANDVRAEN